MVVILIFKDLQCPTLNQNYYQSFLHVPLDMVHQSEKSIASCFLFEGQKGL
jgi:hypothetical protein